MTERAPITDRLEKYPDAVLNSDDLAELGYSKKAIDAIYRACGAVERWDGFARPMIRVADFLAAREHATYRGDRVRPTRGSRRE